MYGTLRIATVVELPKTEHGPRMRRVTLASILTSQDDAEAAALAFVAANAGTINKRHLRAEFIPHPQRIDLT